MSRKTKLTGKTDLPAKAKAQPRRKGNRPAGAKSGRAPNRPAKAKSGRKALRPAKAGSPRRILIGFALVAIVLVVRAVWQSQGFPESSNRPFTELETQGKGWNVLLISLDTTRPDRLSTTATAEEKKSAKPPIASPTLDRIASGGVVFLQASSPAPITLPSHASLLTGLNPNHHGVRENTEHALSDSWTTLAEHLQDNGYRTGAVVSTFVLDRRFGLAQGFDSYEDQFDGPEPELRLGNVEIPGSVVASRAGRWITDHAKKRAQGSETRPFFLFAHFFDAHTPYAAPPQYQRAEESNPGSAASRYLSELSYQDDCLGVLLDQLERSGESERTLIWVVSDHGESLGEHDEATHTLFVYEATQRAVSVLHLPNGESSEAGLPRLVVPDNVGLVDVVPTLLDLLQLASLSQTDRAVDNGSAQLDGISLLPLLLGQAMDKDRALYMETWSPYVSYHWSPLAAVRTSEWKYIRAPYPELYNLASDPHELKNLAGTDPARVKQLEQRLGEFLARGPNVESGRAASAEELEQLRSLGYLGNSENPVAGSSSKTSVEFDWSQELPDPKRRIQFFVQQFQRGKSLLHARRYSEAIEAFESALEQDPSNNAVRLFLGGAYRQAGKLEQARTSYENALRIYPQSARAWYGLGRTHVARKDWPEAERAFREHTRLLPSSPEGWDGLADVEAGQVRYDQALAFLDSARVRGGLPVLLHGRYARVYQDHLPDPQLAAHHLAEFARILGTDAETAKGQLPTIP